MPLLGKKFPAPVLKPMWPFMVANIVVIYGVNAVANVLMNTDQFKDDPRNPAVQRRRPADKRE